MRIKKNAADLVNENAHFWGEHLVTPPFSTRKTDVSLCLVLNLFPDVLRFPHTNDMMKLRPDHDCITLYHDYADDHPYHPYDVALRHCTRAHLSPANSAEMRVGVVVAMHHRERAVLTQCPHDQLPSTTAHTFHHLLLQRQHRLHKPPVNWDSDQPYPTIYFPVMTPDSAQTMTEAH
jgi:hypothetical protein